ncbi:hypothetical protein CR513_38757, partial [Mucuna pruriens]
MPDRCQKGSYQATYSQDHLSHLGYQWVSPVQVLPKKSRMTVIKNHVCIDYKKLNQVTRKDHFPLPFTDKVLEKLASKSNFCFLDQHKTTFMCPF